MLFGCLTFTSLPGFVLFVFLVVSFHVVLVQRRLVDISVLDRHLLSRVIYVLLILSCYRSKSGRCYVMSSVTPL